MRKLFVFGLMVSLLFVFVTGEQSNPNFTVVIIRDGLPTYSANSRHDYDRLVSVVQTGLVKNTQLQKILDKVLQRERNLMTWNGSILGRRVRIRWCVLLRIGAIAMSSA